MTQCSKCMAKCCKYFALQIDTPKDKEDFENIRWYLAHKRVVIFIEKRKWYLEVLSECRHLLENNLCGIYDKRPRVCREHSIESCEFHSEDFEQEYVFRSLDEFDKYLDNRFKGKYKFG